LSLNSTILTFITIVTERMKLEFDHEVPETFSVLGIVFTMSQVVLFLVCEVEHKPDLRKSRISVGSLFGRTGVIESVRKAFS
jgi:hypothetical protein